MKLEELLTKTSGDDEDDEKLDLSKTKTTNALEAPNSDEGVENENVEDAAEEESGEKGKKKGTRKKRSLNWEEAERGLLLEVIKSKVAFVENRSVDAKSIKAKRLAWSQITKQFNSLNFRHRLLEQIQVQWRSMKNSAKREYQQKCPKSEALEGMRMIEFLEEMQKDPPNSKSQTRSTGQHNAANPNEACVLKKELVDMDEDEDMPLAALPNSTNASGEDTLQTSTIAIPSPPPSTAGGDVDSQPEGVLSQPAPNRRKRNKPKPPATSIKTESESDKAANAPTRKRRQRNLSQAQSVLSDDNETSNNTNLMVPQQQFPLAAGATTLQTDNINNLEMDYKYKQELFKLLKQARLAEIDYARREHEQKLRFEQMEQDLKLRHMCEEHDLRLRQQRREHEARLRAYNLNNVALNGNVQELGRCNSKLDYNNVHMDNSGQQPTTSAEEVAAYN